MVAYILAKYLPSNRKGLSDFTIRETSPLSISIGDIHEDNQFFHGQQFEIVSIHSVEHSPDENDRFPYKVSGKCRLI